MPIRKTTGVFVVVLVVCVLTSRVQAQQGRVVLVDVSRGEVTSDTGLDNQTKPKIVEEQALGGKAMQVAFAAGDSIGQRTKTTNWKPFKYLRFNVLNPGSAVDLELNLVHARSTSYQTRVVVPLAIKPGKNELAIPLATLKNTNGTAPDLANVVRWYLADVNSRSPTLLFGDITLEGSKTTHAPQAKNASKPDVHGDPARVARLRAAQMPAIDKPILFDTPAADAIMSALEIFPADNPWNLVVRDWPLHPDSRAIVASIGADKPLRCNFDMGFVLVPPNQPRVAVNLGEYAAESDLGPFPVPDNIPIEGWPRFYSAGEKKLTLDQVQRDQLNQGGDRHAIVVDPAGRMAYEFYALKKTETGWQAAQTSVFDLKSNKLRPDGWTSTDAAGLPLIPSVVRYDEIKRGSVEHAIRVTVERSRKAYVYPATHHAGHAADPHLPRMGERLRLRRDFPIAGFSAEVATILKGLQTYGMLVADNGLSWSISVAPDPRLPEFHEELRKLKGSDFEVVEPPAGYVPASE